MNSPFLHSFKWVMPEAAMLPGAPLLHRKNLDDTLDVALIYLGPLVVSAQSSPMTLCFCCVLASVLLRSSTFCVVPHAMAIRL